MFETSCSYEEVRTSLSEHPVEQRVCYLTAMIRYFLENDIVQSHQIHEIEAAIDTIVSDESDGPENLALCSIE